MQTRFTPYTKHEDVWVMHAEVAREFKELYQTDASFQHVIETLLKDPREWQRVMRGIVGLVADGTLQIEEEETVGC